MLSSHLCLGLLSCLFPSGFPTKTLYTPLLSPIRATCHTLLIILDFITRTLLSEESRSLSSSLCSFLHSPITSSLLGPNILKHPQPTYLPKRERPTFTSIQNNRQNYISVPLHFPLTVCGLYRLAQSASHWRNVRLNYHYQNFSKQNGYTTDSSIGRLAGE